MKEKSLDVILAMLRERVKEKNLKNTTQREVIMSAMYKHKGHFTPEEILVFAQHEKDGKNKGVLTISGERKVKEEIKEEDYYKVETFFGKFSRSFTLPDNADIENIEASSDNGVLEVSIPKLKDENSKKSVTVK